MQPERVTCRLIQRSEYTHVVELHSVAVVRDASDTWTIRALPTAAPAAPSPDVFLPVSAAGASVRQCHTG